MDNVSPWLQVIAKVNPLTYGVDAVRQVFLEKDLVSLASGTIDDAGLGVTIFGHRMGVLEDALIIGVLGFVFLSAAVWSFSRQE